MAKQLNQREKNTAIVTFLAVLIYGGYTFVYQPLKSELESMDQQISIQQEKKENNLVKIKEGQGLEEKYKSYIEEYKQSGTNEQVMSSLISEIENVAGQLNLHISDLKPQRVAKEEYWNNFSISVTLESSLSDAMHFLYILQDNKHLFRVEELRLEQARREEKQMRTSLVVSRILVP